MTDPGDDVLAKKLYDHEYAVAYVEAQQEAYQDEVEKRVAAEKEVYDLALRQEEMRFAMVNYTASAQDAKALNRLFNELRILLYQKEEER